MFLAVLTALGSRNGFASEFRGQVLDRDSKQPVTGVVVQELSLLGLGPNGSRIVSSGYTNANGQFRLPVPDHLDPQNLSLMVTRKAGSTHESLLNRQGLLVTSFQDVIGMDGHPTLRGNNVIYARLSPRKNHPHLQPFVDRPAKILQ